MLKTRVLRGKGEEKVERKRNKTHKSQRGAKDIIDILPYACNEGRD